MKAIQKLIDKIGIDKLLHFLCGMIVALISLIVFKSFVTAVVLTTWIGIAKEIIIDMRQENNKFDALDLLFTIVGGVIGSFFVYFL